MSKILTVDDDPAIRRLIRECLEVEDYDLREAANGEEALRLIDSDPPDLVLLDVMMPGAIDGVEVCRRARATPAFRGTRVVMLSARGSQEDMNAGSQAGCDAYLVKPFSPMQLLALVALLLGR